MITNTKPYWSVDPFTREIISGPHSGQFRGGSWHIPANTITDEPLPDKAGFAVLALLDDTGTEYVEDHRGKAVYNKQTKQRQEVTELGPLPDALTEQAPGPDDIWGTSSWKLDPAAIDRHKATKAAEINLWRDQQERENLSFEHAGVRWDGGMESKSRMDETLALSAIGPLPPGFFWTTASNIDVPMDGAALQNLGNAMAAARGERGFEIHARQRQMKAEVDLLTTIEAVHAYTVGWPEVSHAG
ncbi:MAG: DUF4376 domain-containing protein [Candidatus Oceanisphaera merdipullorum]|nr:DUF4376 domain-containing protein [Candidatus Oceanisphaera merdipullorum]